jgi:putative polyhydroxyalkanoate system protein
MATIDISLKHKLSRSEAKKRITNLLGSIKKQYGDKVSDIKETWKGDKGEFSFKFMNATIPGTVEITDSSVDITGKLPFAMTFFKEKIKNTIKQKGEALLR